MTPVEVVALLGCSVAQLYEMERRGEFPPAIRLPGRVENRRMRRWRADVVRAEYLRLTGRG